MSSTTPCNNQALLQLDSSSPTSKQRPQRLHTSCSESADLVFNKFIHIDSPRSSAALFKRPGSPVAAKPSSSKWKTVLAHLTPPRLLSRPSVRRSARSRLSPKCTQAPVPSSVYQSALIDVNDAAPTRSLPHVDICAEKAASSLLIDGAAAVQTDDAECNVPYVDAPADCNLQLITCGPSSTIMNPDALDVQRLLQTLTKFANSNAQIDIDNRSHALTTLCSLCVASPRTAGQCIAAGAVEIIFNILNPSADLPSVQAAPTVTAATVEESEKALLLLQQLLTFSAVDGCTLALRNSSLLIATLGKKLLRVSEACTTSVIAVLTMLCLRDEAAAFRKALSETAIPSKLVVVLQVASKNSTKRRAGRLLRLLEEQQQQHKQIGEAHL